MPYTPHIQSKLDITPEPELSVDITIYDCALVLIDAHRICAECSHYEIVDCLLHAMSKGKPGNVSRAMLRCFYRCSGYVHLACKASPPVARTVRGVLAHTIEYVQKEIEAIETAQAQV